MKKIVFVLALFLAMNPLVSVADSSASAKSSNCTVNTCELTVTATPDPYGILLRWNFTESDYEVSINRDGAFVPKFIPAKNGFWRDTSAKYGVIHKYIISIGSMSKTIEATRGSGVAPTISKLEVAPLWLVNEGPYNVRVTISDHYDHNRYQIKGIYFTILGKTKIWRDYNPSGVYNLYGFINSFILSCYGKYELIAQCEYKERVSGNEYVSKKGGKECEADVFVYFHKYGGTKKDLIGMKIGKKIKW